MPDLFNPQDSVGNSFYLTELRYSNAFNQFAFFEWEKMGRTKFKSLSDFMSSFIITENMIQALVKMAEKELKIKRNDVQIKQSRKLIERYLLAEFARHIWIEQGYFRVITKDDSDIKKALEFFAK